MSTKLKREAGSSSLEVMVALILVSVVVLGGSAAVITASRVAETSQREVLYWTAIEYQAETLASSETLAAAGASSSAFTQGGDPGNWDSSSGYGSRWVLADASTGQVLLIAQRPDPVGGTTEDTVVVYLREDSP